MRRVAGVVAALVSVLALSGPAAADETTDIRSVDLTDWPKITLDVTAPKKAVESVAVTENGANVSDFKVESFAEAGSDVDVVLVVDTSGSMEGEPMQSAIAAALDFVRQVPDNIGVGLVTFSSSAEVASDITENHGAVLEDIRNLSATGETALYDAVMLATGLFDGEAQHNLVVLSDGGDTVSGNSLSQATEAAKKSAATIYTVGLLSGEADANALRSLSRQTQGR
ncbi:MAG TPA: vWA domain-containing protein, partial [Actinomycetota bacterium]|nr:vWA domain-containing protein [Actinomycetota bacterium]